MNSELLRATCLYDE